MPPAGTNLWSRRNFFGFRTRRYPDANLTVSGPGPERTASGVIADLLDNTRKALMDDEEV